MRTIAATLTLAACASLAACTPPSSAGQVAVRADTELTRAETAFADAKAFADVLLPLLPADRAALVVKAETVAATALAIARAALTAVERSAALKQAQAATDQINAGTAPAA